MGRQEGRTRKLSTGLSLPRSRANLPSSFVEEVDTFSRLRSSTEICRDKTNVSFILLSAFHRPAFWSQAKGVAYAIGGSLN